MCAAADAAHDADMVNIDSNIRTPPAPPTGPLRRWMQIVGVFYVAQFVMMAVVRAPIRTFGPPGTLARADHGDPLAKFVIATGVLAIRSSRHLTALKASTPAA